MKASEEKPTSNQWQRSSKRDDCDGVTTCYGRKEGEDTTKNIMLNMEVEEKRRAGRPKKIWLDNISDDMKECNITKYMVQNRSVWHMKHITTWKRPTGETLRISWRVLSHGMYVLLWTRWRGCIHLPPCRTPSKLPPTPPPSQTRSWGPASPTPACTRPGWCSRSLSTGFNKIAFQQKLIWLRTRKPLAYRESCTRATLITVMFVMGYNPLFTNHGALYNLSSNLWNINQNYNCYLDLRIASNWLHLNDCISLSVSNEDKLQIYHSSLLFVVN